MSIFHHVYLTAHGSFNSGSWLGESAQIGLRLPYAPVVGGPDKGSIFTPLVNGDLAADSGSTAGTNGTLSRTWTARVGPTGSGQNCDAGAQIDLAEDFRTFLAAIATHQSNTFSWKQIKISGVASDGSVPFNSALYQLTTPIVGGTANTLVPQLAIAVSLRANLVGRRGRGRIYIPALGQGVQDSAGLIPSSTQTALRTALKSLVDNLQNVTGTPDYIPIVSVMSADSDTAVRPLEVRTGNRMDTMQSRRRQVAETYTVTAL